MVAMRRAFFIDLIREIRKSWTRFLSIFTIVLIGVAFFTGIKATAPDMQNTADKYYDSCNMMDIRLLSTLGLTNDDMDAVRAINAVEQAVPAYFTDAVSTVKSTEYVFRLHSLPKNQGSSQINTVIVTQGRYPEKSGECLLEESNSLDLGLKIGDTLTMRSGKDTSITDGVLKTNTFVIVGKAMTPYYLGIDKGDSDIGNGKVTYFMMIPEEDFAYPAYTEAFVTVRGARGLSCYSSEYSHLVEKAVASLQNIGEDRSGIRLDEIKKAATAQLDAAKEEFARKKKDFDGRMATAQNELENARTELVKAEATLASEKENFKTSDEQAKEQIRQGRAELAKGEKDYQQGVKEYNRVKAKYARELAELDSTIQKLNDLHDQVKNEIARIKRQIQDGDFTDEERQALKELIAMYDKLLVQADESLAAANDLNNYAHQQLVNANKRLKQARKDLDDGYKKLAAAEAKLKENEKLAADKFAQAEKDIADGWRQYNDSYENYENGRAQGEEELAAGQEKIIRAEDEIDRISRPQWFVLDRNSQLSFVDYKMTTERIDSIAQVFPIFFFLVAALVCLTTMTRMVDEQRGVIGIYKALGYPNSSIAMKYVAYSAVASAFGSAGGLAAGLSIFPQVIYRSWLMKYQMPPLDTVEQLPLMAVSFLMGVLVTTLTAWAACRRELRDAPATLMRPKSPKAGKRILLERVSFLWRRLTFSQKVTMRNLFRYKKRFFMTVIGIAGCTALLLSGFGLRNSIGQIVNKQFNEIFTYDLNVRFSADVEPDQQQRIIGGLRECANVVSWLDGSELNVKTRSSGEEIAATMVVPSDSEKFHDYVTLRERTTKLAENLPSSGVVITEKLSKELGIGIGGTIELDNGLGARKKVIVTGVTENYVFHYVYMSRDAYKEVFRLDPKLNSLMIRLRDDSAKAEDDLASMMISGGGVSSVTFYSSVADSFGQMVKSLDTIVLVIILCAGLLAFVVLYNLTNINIGERIREIATIKVLGFSDREVSAYVFRENICLTIIGALIGLPLGVLLHGYIMTSIEQAGIMFGNYIEPMSFGWSFIITMAFTALVILVMGFRLRSIPMVESLKSVE